MSIFYIQQFEYKREPQTHFILANYKTETYYVCIAWESVWSALMIDDFE